MTFALEKTDSLFLSSVFREDISDILCQVDLLTFEKRVLFNSWLINEEIKSRHLIYELKKEFVFVLVNFDEVMDNSPSGFDGYSVLQQVQSLI